VIRVTSRNDFLSQQTPMCNRSLSVPVIVHSIADTAFFTLHGTVGVTHQADLGRTSPESNSFRMHPDDYPPAAKKSTLHQVSGAIDTTPTIEAKPSSFSSLVLRPIDGLHRRTHSRIEAYLSGEIWRLLEIKGPLQRRN
jgi:hypothetical protein